MEHMAPHLDWQTSFLLMENIDLIFLNLQSHLHLEPHQCFYTDMCWQKMRLSIVYCAPVITWCIMRLKWSLALISFITFEKDDVPDFCYAFRHKNKCIIKGIKKINKSDVAVCLHRQHDGFLVYINFPVTAWEMLALIFHLHYSLSKNEVSSTTIQVGFWMLNLETRIKRNM